ncbi:MAG: LacI family DNA-binding transcriptional regulator [Armatimonadota bacterium]
MTTVRELAKIANVSPATVSMALRGNPAISQKTRERIRALADLYHYTPRELLPGHSYTLGFLLGGITSYFFATGLAGAMRYAFEHSYHIDVLEHYGETDYARKALKVFTEQGADGILLMTGLADYISVADLHDLWSQGLPVVRIGRSALPIDQVYLDDDQLAELAVEYLFALGHRTIAYVGDFIAHSHHITAITRALHRRGLSLAFSWDAGGIIDEHTTSQVHTVLRIHEHPPTAVIAQSPLFAMQLSQIAAASRIRIPQDLSVISYVMPMSYEQLFVRACSPPLTTVEVYIEECGRRACQLLIERLEAKVEPASITPQHIGIPGSLIKRASCAAPGRRLLTRTRPR